jgi:hypothetical protein
MQYPHSHQRILHAPSKAGASPNQIQSETAISTHTSSTFRWMVPLISPVGSTRVAACSHGNAPPPHIAIKQLDFRHKVKSTRSPSKVVQFRPSHLISRAASIANTMPVYATRAPWEGRSLTCGQTSQQRRSGCTAQANSELARHRRRQSLVATAPSPLPASVVPSLCIGLSFFHDGSPRPYQISARQHRQRDRRGRTFCEWFTREGIKTINKSTLGERKTTPADTKV